MVVEQLGEQKIVNFNNKNMKIFWNYIAERHEIYKKKEIFQKPFPWTEDPILKTYKFTNVFRELDTGTIYAIRNIIEKLSKPENIIFNLIIYRLYNRIETMNYIGLQDVIHFKRTDLEKHLRELKDKGKKIFTNAFMVSGYSFIDFEDDKIGRTCQLIEWIHYDIFDLTNELLTKANSEFTYKRLKEIKGIGEFLAYQIAVDLGYWNKKIFDESDFVIAGPGAKRGINLLFEDKSKYSYEECIRILCEIQTEWFAQLDINKDELFSDRNEKELNLMAMENCLCEISKYLKAYYKIGRPRNKYKYNENLANQNRTLIEYLQ